MQGGLNGHHFKHHDRIWRCIKTKGEHDYVVEVIPQKGDWWYKYFKKGMWREYRCLCGKKKIVHDKLRGLW